MVMHWISFVLLGGQCSSIMPKQENDSSMKNSQDASWLSGVNVLLSFGVKRICMPPAFVIGITLQKNFFLLQMEAPFAAAKP
jgi:hypothetical protein